MLTFEWVDELSMKIVKLDNQHKRIFELLRYLGEMVDNNEGREALDVIFDDLISYTEIHFESEEELMTQFEYSDCQLHTDEHNFLLEVALNFKEKLDLKGEPVCETDMKFLLDWFRLHILGADKKLAEFLVEKGVE